MTSRFYRIINLNINININTIININVNINIKGGSVTQSESIIGKVESHVPPK